MSLFETESNTFQSSQYPGARRAGGQCSERNWLVLINNRETYGIRHLGQVLRVIRVLRLVLVCRDFLSVQVPLGVRVVHCLHLYQELQLCQVVQEVQVFLEYREDLVGEYRLVSGFQGLRKDLSVQEVHFGLVVLGDQACPVFRAVRHFRSIQENLVGRLVLEVPVDLGGRGVQCRDIEEELA